MNRVRRRLGDLSSLDHEIFGVAEEGADALIQVVVFRGECRVGSRGNDDAAYMRGVVMSAITAWHTGCLVLDLRELDYSWGSGLLTVIQAPHEFADVEADHVFPVLVVASTDNYEALRSLLETADEDVDRWLFDSMDRALEAAEIEVERFLET